MQVDVAIGRTVLAWLSTGETATLRAFIFVLALLDFHEALLREHVRIHELLDDQFTGSKLFLWILGLFIQLISGLRVEPSDKVNFLFRAQLFGEHKVQILVFLKYLRHLLLTILTVGAVIWLRITRLQT